MGASKRVARNDIAVNFFYLKKYYFFSMVRFGNVLGSSGSVVPLFWDQINNGGPITITHSSICRFFMTDKEAARLVILSGSMSKGGEVFVLDMGKLVKIRDLALKMINLSGKTLKDKKNPYGDIEIKVIGLRPGEKLYEEVLIGDNPIKTENSRIWKAQEKFLKKNDLDKHILKLKEYIKDNDILSIKKILVKIVHNYKPNPKNVDWLQ